MGNFAGTGPADFDVLVVGAGIAGTTAALEAARGGASVALACAGAEFGGSSFFPGTWGLGLVGPAEGASGAEDFARTIVEVGQGMADPELVRVLVEGTGPAILRLEGLGCPLRRAENAGEREFIPCFDREVRAWHGLERAGYRRAISATLGREDVTVLGHCELLDLRKCEGGGFRATFYSSRAGSLRQVRAASAVLATGGFGGLFARTLTMPDVLGTAQAIALRLGAGLVNCEFMQIMPGLVAPARNVVFNEKTFRFARVEGLDGANAPVLLDERAGHGPFTASRRDRAVDFAIGAAGADGARVRYELPEVLPEFMRTYAEWLYKEHGIRPGDELRVAHYAHAANGGILIGADAGVRGVPGLYACGECTGGMHGADRIGGLASANALVFGQIAGREAAAAARSAVRPGPKSCGEPGEADLRAVASSQAGAVLAELRCAMSAGCMVIRTAEGLAGTRETILRLRERLAEGEVPSADAGAVARTVRAELALLSAEALVEAMDARRESRGGHYRADFPEADPAQVHPNLVRLEGDRPIVRPLE